ncbi:MAG TPA: hypothetical protein VHA12_02530, partial [Candidatus Nanoarchaeia archaeon]|nr:hypothetical protein [Candidatus Nanoarchaeia archaeon]
MKIQSLALMQIILMIGMTFSNLYFISSTNVIEFEQESLLSKIIKFFTLIPSVSALEASDFQQGVQTCIKAKSGQLCQEMVASDCASKCDGACVPASLANTPECKPGTCYSPKQGTCQIGSSKIGCESSGGQWNADPNGNIPQCKRGCCILGSQAAFIGSQECSVRSAQLGVTKNFKTEITTEIACLALSGGDTEGACVIEQDFETTCKFTTKSSCLKINGEFHSGYLCSASELQTNCVRQSTTKCLDGKDEIYWFDSCGNKENIYSANKEQSWNNGKVLSKSASCDVTNNKNTCGNCNYLLGSRCGAKTSTQKLADNTQNFVCRSLTCLDDEGKERKNGESWCAFDSSIGVDQGRSTDVVGSRHFRKVCIDGEVRTEPCQDFRNGICVETKNTEIVGGFSSAACRLNTWQSCIDYNFKNQTDKCLTNTDCFLNQVKLSTTYDFKMCVPKYNPGFDTTDKAESAEAICSLASQKCNVVYVKGLGGWKCKQNCECLQKEFAEKMSNLCVSLGDCGPKVNIAGKQTDNYRVSNSPKLSASYLAGLVNYRTPVRGQIAEPGTSALLESGTLGIPSEIPGQPVTNGQEAIDMVATIGGGIGTATLAAAWIAGHTLGATAVGSFASFMAGVSQAIGGVGATAVPGAAGLGTYGGFVAGKVGGTSVIASTQGSSAILTTSQAGFAAAGGALVGAGIGMVVTSLLLKLSGIGPGLPSGITYALLAAGTVAGALIIGAKVAIASGATASSGGVAGFFAGAAGVGWVFLWVTLAVIVVLKILGIGKTKTTVVEFQCQPWQAPNGGSDCSKCGTNGFPCSKYSCQSLGQTCQLVNEGTGDVACVDVSPNDVSAPTITPMQEALQTGFSYSSQTDQGVVVKGPEGCVPAYTNVQFGIKVSEASQCKFDVAHTSSYKDMEFSFGGRNLYLQNHTMSLSIPSLESLGYTDINSTTQADYNLYVRCQDRNGNSNIREYMVNFCVSQGLDVTPPIVVRGEPVVDFVAYNAQNADIKV